MSCDAEVSAFLAERKGSQRAITQATGYAKTSVNKSIVKLRDSKSPLIANLIDGRQPLGPQPPKPRPVPRPTFIVASAIGKRTALEMAWCSP